MLQVLLVDDDPCQLQVRGAILRASGLVVHLATGVESALVAVRSVGEELGLVVTDHFLPGRTGADLVRELRQNASRYLAQVAERREPIEITEAWSSSRT